MSQNRSRAAYRSRRRKKKLSFKKKVIIFFIIVLIAAAVIFLCNNVFFKIDSIEVEGSSRYESDAIISCIDINMGDNLLKIKPEASVENILDEFPYIASVQIERKFPTTLCIVVTEETPVYKAELTTGTGLILNSDSKVLEKVDNFDSYGEVAVYGLDTTGYQVGKCLDENINGTKINSVKLLTESILENDIQNIEYIDIYDPYNISLNFDYRVKAIIGEPVNIEDKICMLATVLSGFSSSDAGTLDLRSTTKAYFNPDR